jgi:hypothetical protein
MPDSFVIPKPEVPTERRVTIRELRYQNYFREIVMGDTTTNAS